MSQRLTRKDIKQKDQFVASVENTLDYSRSHVQTVLVAVAVVAVAVLLVVGIVQFLRSRSADASSALEAALAAVEAPVTGVASKEGEDLTFADEAGRRVRAKELFEVVRSKHGSSRAAELAKLYLAKLAAEEGKLDEAKTYWNELQQDVDDNFLAAQVELNLLTLERQQGDAQALATRLEAMLADKKRPLPEDLVLWELGQTLEKLSRQKDAILHYQKLVDEFPSSPYSGEARQKTATLASSTG